MFKGEDLLEMEPEDRSLAGLFMSFQSPVEIPGVSNIDFLNMAYNAHRRKLGLPELGPIEVYNIQHHFVLASHFKEFDSPSLRLVSFLHLYVCIPTGFITSYFHVQTYKIHKELSSSNWELEIIA